MDYAGIYEQLIERRRKNPISKSQGYCERHHYIPRCMGGGNESWNLVNLTAKEHFVAHHLLHKIYPDDPGLLNAFVAMCTKTARQKRRVHISAKRYAQLKREYGDMRRKLYEAMPEEDRRQRRQNIKEGCAKRTPEQKARIKAKREKYFASLTAEDKERIAEKRRRTIASRSADKQQRISEKISRAHRKLSEAEEQRVVIEYNNGKTALEISKVCGLSREGVNYLLRRRGVKTHAQTKWIDRVEDICSDFKQGKYLTRDALAKAYNTSWSVIKKILVDNGVDVHVNGNRSKASMMRVTQKLMSERVSYQSPFSRVCVTDISLLEAIGKLTMMGLIPRKESRRSVLKKIRHALRGKTKYAFGYEWRQSGA